MQDLPKTMRALIHNQKAKRLSLNASAPLPSPGKDEHLIKVLSTAITTDELNWPRPDELNESNPGVEAAGVIVLGPTNSKFRPGDRIYFRTHYPRAGSAREYSIALESELAPMPKNISSNQAAAVPVSALTAWQALFVQAGLKPAFDGYAHTELENPPRVFINGASGGTGLWATQFAHAVGCKVVGTSTHKTLVREMGADEVINYKETSISDWLSQNPDDKFDLVLDCVGGKSCNEAWRAAKDGGLVLTIVPRRDFVWQWDLDRPAGISETVSGKFFIMESNGQQLAEITKLIENGTVRSIVDSVYPLEDYEKAFQHLDSGRAVGKVVIEVQPQHKASI